jgi:hypothetical protein
MSRFVIAIAGALFVQSSALANLEISDVKARYSPNGPERKSLEVVPGDAIHFSFRMNGLALDGDRKTDAAVEMEISDSSGKLLAQQKSPSLRIQLHCAPSAGPVTCTLLDHARSLSLCLGHDVRFLPT